MKAIYISVFCAIFILFSQNDACLAQTQEFSAETKGTVELNSYVNSEFESAHPGKSALESKKMLEGISKIISSWNKINPPLGFKVRIFNNISDLQSIDVAFSVYLKDSDNGEPYTGDSSSGLTITLNNSSFTGGSPVVGDIIPTPEIVGNFHGFPIYATNLREVAIINKTGLDDFIPCSREDFIKAKIAFEEEIHLAQKEMLKDPEMNKSAKTEAAEMESNIKEMEKGYETLLEIDKSAAAELKKAIDEIKAAVKKAASAPDANTTGAMLMEKELGANSVKIQALKSELEKMSPEERKHQAYYIADAKYRFGNESGLAPEEMNKYGTPLSRFNPEVLKSITSLSIPQLLVVSWNIGSSSTGTPRGYNGNGKGYELADKMIVELSGDEGIWKQILSE